MTDLIERLRSATSWNQSGLCVEAANEIDRLQSDLTQSAEREAALLGKVEQLERELDYEKAVNESLLTQCREYGKQCVEYTRNLAEAQQLAADRLVQMEQALEALEAALSDSDPYINKSKEAIAALRAALEEKA